MYKQKRNYENVQKALYQGVGEYRIPAIQPVQYTGCQWIGFNYAASSKERDKKGLHFFLDDYQFIRLWNNIDYYLPLLKQFQYVMTPDFSLYTDFPKALQIYNHYRKHWIGAYLQENGVKVIPTVCWSDEQSFEWCFDGEPTHSVVAVSSVGTRQKKGAYELFLAGYREMLRRLEPQLILFYGEPPEECRDGMIRMNAYQDKFKEVLCSGW